MLFNTVSLTLYLSLLTALTNAHAEADARHVHHARLTRRFGRERALGDVLGFGDRPSGITIAGRPTSIDPADLPEPTSSDSDSDEPTASVTHTTDSDSDEPTASVTHTTDSDSDTSSITTRSSATASEPTSEPSETTTKCRGLLCGVSSILSPVLPGPTSTPTPTPTSTAATETATETDSDTDAPTGSVTTRTTASSATDTSEPGQTESPSDTTTPEPTSTSSECRGLLCPVTSILSPILGPDPTTTSKTASATDTDSETSTDAPTPTGSGGSTVTPTSTEEEPSPTSSECSGLLCPVTSILSPILPDPTTTSKQSDPTDTDSSSTKPTGTTDPTNTGKPSSTSTGILDPITSILSPVLPGSSTTTKPSSASEPTSRGSTNEPSSTTSGILDPITSVLTSILPGSTSSDSGSGSSRPTSSFTTLLPSGTSSGVGSISTPISSSTISFPSTPSNVSATDIPISTTSIPTTTSPSISIPSDFSFVTGTSLARASSESSLTPTLTDPDAATSTVSLASDTSASPSAAPLPANLPSRIYSPNSVMTAPEGHTAVSVLFNSQLGWEFVAQSFDAQGQLFAFFPNIIARALGVDPSDVPTFALQVVQPTEYTSVSQVNLLKTSYLIFVPSNQVDNLSTQIRTLNSAFYTSSTGIEKQIADAVDPASILTATPNNIGTGSGDGAIGDSGGSSGNSNKSDDTRRNAIIGVTTVLGGIALMIVAWLAIRAYKRNQETKHRRLSHNSDQFDAGLRQGGEAFDQDSIGGQRRRSFYFAEDSLRGAFRDRPEEDDGYDHRLSRVPGMRERRPVVPAAIGQPILRESTMNW